MKEIFQQTIDFLFSRIVEHSGKTAISTSLGTVVAALTLNQWALIVGIIATIITTAVNWYYKAKESKIRLAEAKANGAKIDK